jgi:ubiquinone/menaquinone biosynthesis C-methylase UbiE
MDFDPRSYRAWFQTPLGRAVDADEKAVLFAMADLKPGERVLDVGCGDGTFTEEAARRTGDVVGLDLSRAMLDAGAARLAHVPGIRWVEGDATALPFPDAAFDVVMAVAMLGVLPDPTPAIREAARVLRPGGRLVLGVLNRWSSWAVERRVRGWLKPESVWRDARFSTAPGLRRLLANAGFRDVAVRGVVYYPPIDSAAFLRLARPFERAACALNLPGAALLVAVGSRATSPSAPR